MEPIYTLPTYTVHDIGTVQALSQIYPQNVRDFNIPKVWKQTRGKGIVVLVLDTGCPVNHKDLVVNVDVSKCRSFVNGEDIYDRHVGHSTHCCGTIAASDNTIGIVGIAPEATIVTAKVLNKYGACSPAELIRGLEYALELKPDVINMSLGGEFPMAGVEKVLQKIVQNNTIIIASAGNNGENKILYPAQHDECIAVGSYNNLSSKNRSKFSSWGETLDIMGPGEEILSTFLDNGYAVLSGTSMAAPAITGVVALLLAHHKSKNRRLTVQEVKNLLFENAMDVGDKGKDLQFGWGFINPEKLFAAKVAAVPVKPTKTDFITKLKNFFGKLFK